MSMNISSPGEIKPSEENMFRTNTRAILTIALLVLLGIFWMGIGVWLIRLGLTAAASTENMRLIYFGLGIGNIIMAFFIFRSIRNVSHRYRAVYRDLKIFVILSLAVASLGTCFGPGLLVCLIPLYALLGILLLVNKDYYSELAPRDLHKSAVSQS
jgi:hypothetical protein